MRRFWLRRQPTSERELARVGLVLGPEAAEQLRRRETVAQHAALQAQCIRWLVIGLFVVALVGWLWDVCNGGVR